MGSVVWAIFHLLNDAIPPALGSQEVKIQGSPVFQLSASCRQEVAEAMGSGFTMLRALGERKPPIPPSSGSPGLPRPPRLYSGRPFKISRPLQNNSLKTFKLDPGKSFQDRDLFLLTEEEKTPGPVSQKQCEDHSGNIPKALEVKTAIVSPPDFLSKHGLYDGVERSPHLDQGSCIPSSPLCPPPWVSRIQGGPSPPPPPSANQFEQ